MNITIDKMQLALKNSWSDKSSTLWNKNNPAKGQCGVTALVVNDIMGGEILKTKFIDGWHYYNRINENIIDFTKSQFDSPINYDNIKISRDEAFADTTIAQYEYLKSKVTANLNEVIMSDKSKKLRIESQKRRSYRHFLPEKIDNETIKDWIMTASSAPSGANKQPWHFVVVTDDDIKANIRKKAEEIEEIFYKEKISNAWRNDLKKLKVDCSKPFLTEVPCLIVVFKEIYKINKKGEKEKNYYPGECTGLATGLLINAIRYSGYQSLTYTPAPMTFLKNMFNRPEGETPFMILAVGKGDPSYILPDIKRKNIDEIAEFY